MYFVSVIGDDFNVMTTKSDGKQAILETFKTRGEAEDSADRLNLISGHDEEMFDLPDEMQVLLDALS